MGKSNQFTEQFKQRLYQQIKEIERHSVAEVVVIVRHRSGHYYDVSLWAGFVFELLVMGFLLFTPMEFNPYWICFASVVSFLFGFLVVELFPWLKRLLIKRPRLLRTVEIYGRAIFQKAGIYYTKYHTGLLVFVSLFEKKVMLLPDKGLKLRIPEHYWLDMEREFDAIFSDQELWTEALLNRLKALGQMLSDYVPPVENDINELPDDLEVDL